MKQLGSRGCKSARMRPSPIRRWLSPAGTAASERICAGGPARAAGPGPGPAAPRPAPAEAAAAGGGCAARGPAALSGGPGLRRAGPGAPRRAGSGGRPRRPPGGSAGAGRPGEQARGGTGTEPPESAGRCLRNSGANSFPAELEGPSVAIPGLGLARFPTSCGSQVDSLNPSAMPLFFFSFLFLSPSRLLGEGFLPQ